MQKLEDIPKKDVFNTPEGYFDKLPGSILARVEKDRKPAYKPVFVFSLKYALPAIILVALTIFWIHPFSRNVDVDSLLASVQTEDLVAYLNESDITTDELIESGDFSATDIHEIEGEVYDLNMTTEDIQNIVDDLTDPKFIEMKKLLIILFAVANLVAIAQDDDLQAEPSAGGNVRQKINAARAAYITNRLQLTTGESEKFWPVYNEYTQKRQDLKIQYRMAKLNGTEEKVLLDMHLKMKQQELDLEKDYSARLLLIISPQKLAQLRDAEQEFRKLLLRQIQQRQGGRRQRLQGY